MVLVFNIVVLGCLFLLLCFQEFRYRRFRKRVAAVRENLLGMINQLRSPLSTIRKYGHMLQERELGSISVAQAEALSKMESAREDMMLRLNRFLTVSRLEEGSIAVKPIRLRLSESIDAALGAVSPLIQKRSLSVRVLGNRRLMTVADPLLLHGILDELFLNSAAYSRKRGSITVQISVKNSRPEVRISDTGIGISDEEKTHVFEKFFRGERAKTMHEGNGLGLYFARLFAKTLGGTLTFESRMNQGATFTLVLPKK